MAVPRQIRSRHEAAYNDIQRHAEIVSKCAYLTDGDGAHHFGIENAQDIMADMDQALGRD